MSEPGPLPTLPAQPPAARGLPSSARILVADRDGPATELLIEALEARDYLVELCEAGDELTLRLADGDWDVVLSDPETADMEHFGSSITRPLAPAVILMAAFGSIDDAVQAMRRGAFDYLSKPLSEDQVLVAVARALEQRDLEAENRRLRADLEERFQLGRILSRSPAMGRIFEAVEAVADTHATILIAGESGTGKSMLARTIHQCSARAAQPFIVVNCGALPESLLESELFGHARGAFTGAVKDKLGKFEAADGGTIFLDEIASAPLDLQVKLLRVLEDKAYERIGENRTRKADVRVITASNSDLRQAVARGEFREDLFYRINVLALELPSLRQRTGDVPLLAEHFLTLYAAEYERPARAITPETMALLSAYSWPGNVRELENCVERAVLLSQGTLLTPASLSPEVRAAASQTAKDIEDAQDAQDIDGLQEIEGTRGAQHGPRAEVVPGEARGLLQSGAPPAVLPLRQALEAPEKRIISRALALNAGNRKKTAAMLGINRSTLFNKMRKYDLMEFEPQET